ncbi:MAG TPA: hypothetical protein VKO18_14140 [Terriglobia bacterium]|nr:hypothetical protein [Terriglobia bacterium]
MSTMRRKVRFIALLLLVCSVTSLAQEPPPAPPAVRQDLPPTNDPKEIVRRALDVDKTDFQLARNYTFERREEIKVLDTSGAPKKHEINTYDVAILYDQPYSRRIRKDDKPLTEQEERKEAEKLDRFIAERKNESEKEHETRLAKQEAKRQEERAFVRDVIKAYDFRIVGEEQVEGHDAYIVQALPRKDFHPTQPHADILPKLRGKIWISKRDYGCVKLEAETLDTISWGLFLLRIHKGTKFRLEQTRVNDEIWLPRRMSLNASARVALFANGAVDWESSFSKYKKFTSAARILPGVAEVQPTANSPR